MTSFPASPTCRLRAMGLGTILLLAGLAGSAAPVLAQDGTNEGDYLYRVSLVRAAPGEWHEMVEALQEDFALAREAGEGPVFWMRHSQGDHWDFMVIRPMESFGAYHAAERRDRRDEARRSPRGRALAERMSALTAYREDWYARSVPVGELARRFDEMDFYHVEMFAGLPGHRAELVEQRRMENRFYRELGARENLIFVREAGSNWDAMTVGFYENLAAFAEPSGTAEAQEAAARAAGFDGVRDIGPYLRSLLSYHNDTLGVRVR